MDIANAATRVLLLALRAQEISTASSDVASDSVGRLEHAQKLFDEAAHAG